MQQVISKQIVETWLKGWSLSRGVPPPVKYQSGLKVDVGLEDQKARYVFPELNDDVFRLADAINEPWVFLKVCTGPENITNRISGKWTIQPQGYMMTCFHPMNALTTGLHEGYKLEFEHYHATTVVKIVTQAGEPAAIGRVVAVDDLAVYDRIITEEKHRRKGLARFLMKELEKIALSKGVSKNFLVATEEGKLLYQSLGWEVYSLYTSIVIPG